MAQPNVEPRIEQKPGAGIDRTQIREMLALTPADRATLIIDAARKLAEILAYSRRI
jgi:hypothetical protein